MPKRTGARGGRQPFSRRSAPFLNPGAPRGPFAGAPPSWRSPGKNEGPLAALKILLPPRLRIWGRVSPPFLSGVWGRAPPPSTSRATPPPTPLKRPGFLCVLGPPSHLPRGRPPRHPPWGPSSTPGGMGFPGILTLQKGVLGVKARARPPGEGAGESRFGKRGDAPRGKGRGFGIFPDPLLGGPRGGPKRCAAASPGPPAPKLPPEEGGPARYSPAQPPGHHRPPGKNPRFPPGVGGSPAPPQRCFFPKGPGLFLGQTRPPGYPRDPPGFPFFPPGRGRGGVGGKPQGHPPSGKRKKPKKKNFFGGGKKTRFSGDLTPRGVLKHLGGKRFWMVRPPLGGVAFRGPPWIS